MYWAALENDYPWNGLICTSAEHEEGRGKACCHAFAFSHHPGLSLAWAPPIMCAKDYCFKDKTHGHFIES